ncbi:MAG: hypothetical protein ACTSQU_17475 [Promethearchaeota archaeon]
MKSNQKTIILIALGIFIVFSTISKDNLNFNAGNNNEFNLDNKNVKISAAPGPFILSSNTSFIIVFDSNTRISLAWTSSEGAESYDLYGSLNYYITEKDGPAVYQIVSGLTTNSIVLELPESGKFYFVVVAYNGSGETMSNVITIEVDIRQFNYEYKPNAEAITIVVIVIIVVIAVFISGILLIYKRKQKRGTKIKYPKKVKEKKLK